ncbi:MAG: hypothetical protein AB7O68_01920 [Pirellulales bacterium]
MLPKVRRRLVRWGIAALLLVCAAAGLNKLFWNHHAKRFQELRPGVLYRTGQPSEWGLDYLVEWRGVKTVISLQLYPANLRHGLYDHAKPSGGPEAAYVERLGAQPVHWSLGEEACWPWPTPWVYESWFRTLDEPSNWPIAIHCQGGRHRTGTLAALFRLEYDRWPVERALAEMYSFKFGSPVPVQEHNLRTYFPRPRPGAEEWGALAAELSAWLTPQERGDYETAVRALRSRRADPSLQNALEDSLQRGVEFAMCLTARLVDSADEPLACPVAACAAKLLDNPAAAPRDWSTAAAVVADFGTSEQQSRLLALLSDEPRDAVVSPRYAALAAGVSNRYTINRIPYWRAMLDDSRHHPEPAAQKYRYCETAAARMSVVANQNFVEIEGHIADWSHAADRAGHWLAAHEQYAQLSTLIGPEGPRVEHVAERENDEGRGAVRP